LLSFFAFGRRTTKKIKNGHPLKGKNGLKGEEKNKVLLSRQGQGKGLCVTLKSEDDGAALTIRWIRRSLLAIFKFCLFFTLSPLKFVNRARDNAKKIDV
jgi:hypothetical protein